MKTLYNAIVSSILREQNNNMTPTHIEMCLTDYNRLYEELRGSMPLWSLTPDSQHPPYPEFLVYGLKITICDYLEPGHWLLVVATYTRISYVLTQQDKQE